MFRLNIYASTSCGLADDKGLIHAFHIKASLSFCPSARRPCLRVEIRGKQQTLRRAAPPCYNAHIPNKELKARMTKVLFVCHGRALTQP